MKIKGFLDEKRSNDIEKRDNYGYIYFWENMCLAEKDPNPGHRKELYVLLFEEKKKRLLAHFSQQSKRSRSIVAANFPLSQINPGNSCVFK